MPVASSVSGLQAGDPVEDRRLRLADGKETSLNQLPGTGFAVHVFGLDAEGVVAAESLRASIAAQLEWEGAVLALAPVGGAVAAPAVEGPPVVLDDDAVAVVRGAVEGELFAVRPDGLLLARGAATEMEDLLPRLALLLGDRVGAAEFDEAAALAASIR